MAMMFALMLSAMALGGCETKITDDDVYNEEIKLSAVQKLHAKGDSSLLLVDVQNPKDFAAKHIAGAISRPWTEFSGRKDDIDPRLAAYKNLIIYAANRGSPSVIAAGKRMLTSGYSVKVFLGGLEEWTAAGGATESGEPKPRDFEQRSTIKSYR
jgi:rhodanese-related sulfurtransferase